MSLIIAVLFGVVLFVFVYMTSRVLSGTASSYRDRFSESASNNLAEMFIFIEPEKFFFLYTIFVITVFFITLIATGYLVPAVIITFVLGLSPLFIYKFMKKRRLKQSVERFPDALQSMANAIKSGASLQQALELFVKEEKSPIAQELELFLKELRLGVDFSEALDNFYERVPAVEIQLATVSMKISRKVGGNLSETLERMAHTLRRKLEMEGKIKSITAQGKLQGIVMTGLPIVLGLILYKMDPEAMGRMFTEVYGWVVLAVIIIMEFIGYFFIRKIVNIDV